MSERGVFAVDRGIWSHPVFSDEPFTEREAWMWLVSEASYKPRKKRVGNAVADLRRGQLAASLRFIAKAWSWNHHKVARFLARLKTETMIEHQTSHDYTTITICNYDTYQRVSLPDATTIETPIETPARHERDKLEDNKNIEIDSRSVGSARASAFTDGSKKLADAFWQSLGITSPLQVPPELAGTDWRAIEWERAGWTEGIISTSARKIGPGKPLSYYEKAFASNFAKQQAPLPVVEIADAPRIQVHADGKRGQMGAPESLSSVARRLAAEGVAFGERPATPSLRSIEGGADVRLLSKSRGE